MKAIICELCGSNNIVKTDGFFTCQNCGTKYDLEEAKKLMGVATVKVDRSSEVDNRLKNAINEYNAGNTDVAYQLFVELLNIDPDNWKGIIYKALSDGWHSSVKSNRMISTASEIVRALEILRREKESDSEFAESCKFIFDEFSSLADALFGVYVKYNNELKGITDSYKKVQSGANVSAADHAVSGVVGGLLTGNFLLAGQSVIGSAQISNAGNMSKEINDNENERVNTYNNGCHYTCKAINMVALYCLNHIKIPEEVSDSFFDKILSYVKCSEGFLTTKEVENGYNLIVSKATNFKNRAHKARLKREQEQYEIEHADEIAAKKESDYNAAINDFEKIFNLITCQNVKAQFSKLSGFKDSSLYIKKCEEKEIEYNYINATKKLEKAVGLNDYKEAKKLFENIISYKDSDELSKKCDVEIKKQEEAERLKRELEAEQKRIADEKAAKKRKKAIAATVSIIVVTSVLLTILLTKVIIPKNKFNKAMSLIESGNYETAYALLDEIGKSEDIALNKYNRAMDLIDFGDYKEAYNLLNGLNYMDSENKIKMIEESDDWIKICPIGKTVFFGEYEQDNDLENGKEKIEWIVLEREENKILIISKYAIDNVPILYDKFGYTGWHVTYIRHWLNEKFLGDSFSSKEKNSILSLRVSPEGTNSDDYSIDKVFLLSVSEVKKYFGSEKDRQCQLTEYSNLKSQYKYDNENCNWWLCSFDGNRAAFVDEDGKINVKDGFVRFFYGVRPALWIDLSIY